MAISTQLKVAQQELALQAAEFAFQRAEYESEIESLRSTDGNLRDQVLKESKEKAQVLHDAERKFQHQLDEAVRQQRDYMQTLQVQVTRLRSRMVELQSENEVLREEQHRLQRENEILKQEMVDESEIAATKLALLHQLINSEEEKTTQTGGEVRVKLQQFEKERAELQNSLRIAQTTITALKSELAVANHRGDSLNGQLKKLTDGQIDWFERFTEEHEQKLKMQSEAGQLQNTIDILQNELRAQRKRIATIEDNTKHAQMVDYCSPIQRRRIDILKGIEANFSELTKELFDMAEAKVPSVIRGCVLAMLFVNRWKASVGKKTEICDHRGGLSIFGAVPELAPIKVMALLRKAMAAMRVRLVESERRTEEAEQATTETAAQSAKERRALEAVELQLRSAKKCHRILQKELGSFVEFHDEMVNEQRENAITIQ
ncbi:MAG: hypothetical protein LBD77_00505 [Bifidobacteriaceae bacterium]|nr:hypothetical protein [Bifidobacteriaceae bacterium]